MNFETNVKITPEYFQTFCEGSEKRKGTNEEARELMKTLEGIEFETIECFDGSGKLKLAIIILYI